MFVETVTAPRSPARAIIAASRSSWRALSTSCGTSAQQRAEAFGIRHAGGAHQHRLAGRVRPADLGHHGLLFLSLCREDNVRMIHADHRAVGRDRLHLQAVDACWNSSDCVAAVPVMPHTIGYNATRCWSVIWPRIIPCDLAATPSLASMAVCRPAGQRRSSAIRPLNSSTISMAPFLHDVVHVAVQQGVGMQRVLDGPVNREVALIEEIPAAQRDLDGVDSGVGQRRRCARRDPR